MKKTFVLIVISILFIYQVFGQKNNKENTYITRPTVVTIPLFQEPDKKDDKLVVDPKPIAYDVLIMFKVYNFSDIEGIIVRIGNKQDNNQVMEYKYKLLQENSLYYLDDNGEKTQILNHSVSLKYGIPGDIVLENRKWLSIEVIEKKSRIKLVEDKKQQAKLKGNKITEEKYRERTKKFYSQSRR